MASPASPLPDPSDGAGAAGPSPPPVSPHTPLSARTALVLIGINALWGGSSVAAKAALVSVPPVTLAFARFSLAAVLLYALAGALRVDLRVARRDWLPFWGMGAVGLTLTYLLVYTGLRHTTAADSALLHAAEPVFLTILSVLMLRERMPWARAAGIAVGLIGVFLVISRGGRLVHFSGAALGDLTISLGLVCESLSVILGKRLVARYPPLTVLTYQMLTGSVVLAPCAVAEAVHTGWRLSGHTLTGPVLWSLLYLVLPCTVFAYTAWFLLLGAHDAGDLSVFLFVQPVFGALLGFLVQHDPVTAATVAGAVLVLLGIALIRRRPPDPEYLAPA